MQPGAVGGGNLAKPINVGDAVKAAGKAAGSTELTSLGSPLTLPDGKLLAEKLQGVLNKFF